MDDGQTVGQTHREIDKLLGKSGNDGKGGKGKGYFLMNGWMAG